MKTPKKKTKKPISESDKKCGLTRLKKNELDALSVQVLNEQANVAQYQSIVDALTIKSVNFQAILANANANLTQASNNKIRVDQLLQSAIDLQKNAKVATKEIAKANLKTRLFVENFNKVMGKLIYSAEVINKLANLTVRMHGPNPLISDELVNMVTTAASDANNAVALSLVALQSAFVAQATGIETESSINLGYTQAVAFTSMLTIATETDDATPLQTLFDRAYTTALKNYTLAEKANISATKELNTANENLNSAQIKLKSLQSGLAAVSAAALAT